LGEKEKRGRHLSRENAVEVLCVYRVGEKRIDTQIPQVSAGIQLVERETYDDDSLCNSIVVVGHLPTQVLRARRRPSSDSYCYQETTPVKCYLALVAAVARA